MKKSVVLPLITTEMHPGEAIEFTLDVIHPFTQDAAIDSDLQAVLQEIVDHPKAVCDRRESLLQTWDARARDLVPESEKLLKQIPDRHLRCLLRGVPDDQPVELGAFFHVALWRELLQQASCSDVDLVDQIMAGMPIVGDIASSHRWAADRKPHADHLSVDSLRSRAWEFRSKVLRAIKRAPLTEHSPKVWEATLEDVAEGAAVGPFFEESEVSEFVGDDHWIPTQRFEVVQKNKLRGVDSATSNGINMATVVTEKLELPSTDANVAVIKWLRSRLPDKALRGWVLDERRAYRQVPISPGHRKWSVVALKDPSTGKVAFFVMVGHRSGWSPPSTTITGARRPSLTSSGACSPWPRSTSTTISTGSSRRTLPRVRSRSPKRCTGGWVRGLISRSSSCAPTPRSWGLHTTSSSIS